MSVYIDKPFFVSPEVYPNAPQVFHNRESAHLIADTRQELIAYAIKLGMNPQWIQKYNTEYEHFDLTGKKLRRALRDKNVIKINAEQFIEKIKEKRNAIANRS